MLVLSRKKLEQIHIGSEITITIVRLTGDKVRIGIEAPQRLSISRGSAVREPASKPQPQPGK